MPDTLLMNPEWREIAGERRECAKCVCSTWREPLALTDEAFRLGVGLRA
jgi:hypothetical protein